MKGIPLVKFRVPRAESPRTLPSYGASRLGTGGRNASGAAFWVTVAGCAAISIGFILFLLVLLALSNKACGI
jgi:hypothetical protein